MSERASLSEYVPLHENFKRGDRIAYINQPETAGRVLVVTPHGYRIRWDDGYKDDPGQEGCYGDHELVPEEAAKQ